LQEIIKCGFRAPSSAGKPTCSLRVAREINNTSDHLFSTAAIESKAKNERGISTTLTTPYIHTFVEEFVGIEIVLITIASLSCHGYVFLINDMQT
jgi:hypothetical protein